MICVGGIPGPVLLGTLFDRACLVWQGGENESRGSCWVYDSQFMATGMTLTLIILSVIKTFCYVLASLLYKSPQQIIENSQEETCLNTLTETTARNAHTERVTQNVPMSDCVRLHEGMAPQQRIVDECTSLPSKHWTTPDKIS